MVNGLELAVGEATAGGEVVVLGDRVRETLSDDHHTGPPETEQPAERHSDQQQQHAQVEDEVPGLAQVAALGGHRFGAGVVAV